MIRNRETVEGGSQCSSVSVDFCLHLLLCEHWISMARDQWSNPDSGKTHFLKMVTSHNSQVTFTLKSVRFSKFDDNLVWLDVVEKLYKFNATRTGCINVYSLYYVVQPKINTHSPFNFSSVCQVVTFTAQLFLRITQVPRTERFVLVKWKFRNF